MKLKAYAWDDDYHGNTYIVWTETAGKAKAVFAAEHDTEFIYIDWGSLCCRTTRTVI